MLYLNLADLEVFDDGVYHLTLTSVVFEFKAYLNISDKVEHLTLTSVVFEC